MKIATKVTVDIDIAAWREEYGTVGSDRDVAAAVREYIANLVQGQLSAVGVLTEQ